MSTTKIKIMFNFQATKNPQLNQNTKANILLIKMNKWIQAREKHHVSHYIKLMSKKEIKNH